MKILLVGDSCEDVFIEGACERLSPEMPVPVFVPVSTKKSPGMAGNVLANLKSLGANEVISLMPVKVPAKVRFVDQKTGHHFLRVDEGTNTEVLSLDDFAGKLNREIFDAVVISDYSKGYLPVSALKIISGICANMGLPCFTDTKGFLGEWSAGMIVKINQHEFQMQLDAGLKPCQLCGKLIVTYGGDGMTLYDSTEDDYHVSALPIEVKDGAGCGDSVLAALCIRYLETGDLKSAMDWASKVGAVAVSKRGVVAVKREEVA